jgi:hypothetical protein
MGRIVDWTEDLVNVGQFVLLAGVDKVIVPDYVTHLVESEFYAAM